MLQKLRSHLTYANVTGTLALFVALGGTTYAATGGNFILGQSNSASSTTGLSAGTTGPAFRATNTSTGTAGSFNVTAGHPPLTVNSGTKVANLNADKLDGKDSTAFLDGCGPSGAARFGRICAGSDGVNTRSWSESIYFCAGLGLRIPTVTEAVTLAVNYDVPGISGTEYMWTVDQYPFNTNGSSDALAIVNDNGNLGGTFGATGPTTVCVTEPTNN